MNMKATRLAALTAVALLSAQAASAKGMVCSIHPKKGTPEAELPKLATVSQADAEKAALAKLATPNTTVAGSELEAEHGCLLWSFDLKVPGDQRVHEVQVDAGNGKILSSVVETSKDEKDEAAADAKKDEHK